MTAMILPGTYIEVRAEGLIAPGQVTVGNVGVVGTAAKGPVNDPVLLSNFNDAVASFGPYDSFMNPDDPTKRRDHSLTLVRALELAFANGASTVYAMRVGKDATAAAVTLKAGPDDCVTLTASSPGNWSTGMIVRVEKSNDNDVLTVPDEEHAVSLPNTKQLTLLHKAKTSPRNRAVIRKINGSVEALAIVEVAPAAAADPKQARFVGDNLEFGDDLEVGSKVFATYRRDPADVVKVTIKLDPLLETYLVTDGNDLIKKLSDLENPSALVTAKTKAADKPEKLPTEQLLSFSGGTNDEAKATYDFTPLLDVDAHIIVAAGQTDTTAGAELHAHCQKASTDEFKRDRIAVVGSAPADKDFVDTLIGNTLASDRVVFVAPGFKTNSSATDDASVNPITLPGAYTAAVIAGMLASLPPHISLTNKAVAVRELEVKFNNAQLTELVQNRVTALEVSRGIRVLRGQTTDDGPFREITTRRIVDYAKYGVRAAAGPYIGLLNNDRVRSALRATINSFLQGMLDDEMLVAYKLDVSATRDEQIKGIVQVTISLQPVFSINFIRVTMILS